MENSSDDDIVSESSNDDLVEADEELTELELLMNEECGDGRGPDPERLGLESAADVALDMDDDDNHLIIFGEGDGLPNDSDDDEE